MKIDMTEIFLLLILGTAIASDLRWKTIPNWLTGPSILVGLGFHTAMNQFTGLLFSLEGAAVGLGLFVILYVCGWMGAGDVKLFAAVGSFLGPAQTISAAVAIALVGGLLALVVLGSHQGWRTMGLWIWSYVQTMLFTRSVQALTPVQVTAPKVPYAIAIGIGTIGSYWWYPFG
ncbi:MAG TPA: A24 family peptidase [Nitrospiraceae bacterium]|nr:A24 family peptidase [Nitrospiraceae bacterium]